MPSCTVASDFVRLLKLANCLSITATSSKFVTGAIKCCIRVCTYGKGHQIQSSIMLLLEHNFRHNAVVLRVTPKSIMLKFSSIMYLTLPQEHQDSFPEPIVTSFRMVDKTDGALGAVCHCPAFASNTGTQSPCRNKLYSALR